jgi:hypothetical protein
VSPSPEFAISSRTLCARPLVSSWPEMAVGRRPPPRRRGPERRRGRPLFLPVGFTGPPPCGPRLRAACSLFPSRAREPGRKRPRAGLIPRAGPVSIIKIVFCFLLLFMMKNIVENVFVFI